MTRLRHLHLDNNELSGTGLLGLDLSDNNLAGGIPVELTGLPNLVRLDLSNNPLGGEIPSELGALSNLEGLGLAGNDLTRGIPVELTGLTELQWLDLSGNRLSGAPARSGRSHQAVVPVPSGQRPERRDIFQIRSPARAYGT